MMIYLDDEYSLTEKAEKLKHDIQYTIMKIL